MFNMKPDLKQIKMSSVRKPELKKPEHSFSNVMESSFSNTWTQKAWTLILNVMESTCSQAWTQKAWTLDFEIPDEMCSFLHDYVNTKFWFSYFWPSRIPMKCVQIMGSENLVIWLVRAGEEKDFLILLGGIRRQLGFDKNDDLNHRQNNSDFPC